MKCLKLPAQLEGEERNRFLRAFLDEGKLLHRLSRSNAGIVQALDVGAAVSPTGVWTPYLALEWLEGTSLDDDMVDRERRAAPPLTIAEVIALLDTAAAALAVAHAEGVAHRDIKPANLFIAEVGGRRVVKVVDFGIAKVMSDALTTSRAHAQTGATLPAFSPRYGAPEQFDRNYGATGPWTDVFALALVIVELVTGRPALDGQDTLQLFVSATNPERRPTPRALGTAVTDDVERVLARALSVNPADRYGSIGEMWQELKTAAATPARIAEPRRLLATAAPHASTLRTEHQPKRKRTGAIVGLSALGYVTLASPTPRDRASTTTISSSTLPGPPVSSPPPRPTPPAAPPPTTPAQPPRSAPAALSPPTASSILAPTETIRASHILVSYAGANASKETRSREEARARAEEALARIAAGEDFVQLAAEYGDDATRSRGGDLGSFSRSRFPAPFSAAAFAVAPGASSGIVETRYGFHIIRRAD